MMRICSVSFVGLLLVAVTQTRGGATDDRPWTVYVANDNCPDYTWGLTEEQTRQAFADVVRGHLDEMKRTDTQPAESRDRYNMAVTMEAICFVEKYPQRKQELIGRIKEGRVYVSPYLCNSLWGMQSAEGVLRTFYPARRLEREWGFPLTTAHHIEEPSLPWGTATLLAGCGIRHLTNPYYGYDSTFRDLKCPPLFYLEGPDGSRIKVWLDRFASSKSSYTQGAAVLRKPESIEREWIDHYAGLGAVYPLRAILASGTHGDISPHSGDQAREFAEAIVRCNGRPGEHPRLVNATFPMFWQAVEAAEARQPFLPVVRGSFGHSWDVWPVSLAKYVAAMREGERRLLAAESLLAVANGGLSGSAGAMRPQHQRAEWCWAMLSDHAWNGTDERNKRHNAALRRQWGEELNRLADEIEQAAWSRVAVPSDTPSVIVFNSLSVPRRDLVRLAGTGKTRRRASRRQAGARATGRRRRTGGDVLCRTGSAGIWIPRSGACRTRLAGQVGAGGQVKRNTAGKPLLSCCTRREDRRHCQPGALGVGQGVDRCGPETHALPDRLFRRSRASARQRASPAAGRRTGVRAAPDFRHGAGPERREPGHRLRGT